MSLFENVPHLATAPEPGAIPDNTYEAFVFDVSPVKPTKGGDKDGITITYKINGGDYDGEVVREWKQVPRVAAGSEPTHEQNKQFGYIKQRLSDLGVPAERLNSVDANDLIGTKVLITTKANNGYVNINRVSLDSGDSVTSGSSPFGL